MHRIAHRIVLIVTAFILTSGFGSGERLFAPDSDPWPRWTTHDDGSTARIDHVAWSRFLSQYLTMEPGEPALLRYDAVSPADRQQLDSYIESLAAQKISTFNRPVQKAYWINLYNALTVQVILDHYPVDSIRDIDISPGFFSDGPWGKELVSVEGVGLSLNDIEHRILRPGWEDARIHYAVNCASIGCPDLAAEAYDEQNIEQQLDSAARAFVNSPRGVTINKRKVTVSKIFDWFYDDFGGSKQAVLTHLKSYAAPALKQQLAEINDLHDTAYDWSLNLARGAGQ